MVIDMKEAILMDLEVVLEDILFLQQKVSQIAIQILLLINKDLVIMKENFWMIKSMAKDS